MKALAEELNYAETDLSTIRALSRNPDFKSSVISLITASVDKHPTIPKELAPLYEIDQTLLKKGDDFKALLHLIEDLNLGKENISKLLSSASEQHFLSKPKLHSILENIKTIQTTTTTTSNEAASIGVLIGALEDQIGPDKVPEKVQAVVVWSNPNTQSGINDTLENFHNFFNKKSNNVAALLPSQSLTSSQITKNKQYARLKLRQFNFLVSKLRAKKDESGSVNVQADIKRVRELQKRVRRV